MKLNKIKDNSKVFQPKSRFKVADTRPKETESWRSSKETAAQRGYGYKWQKSRLEFLKVHPLCVYCDRIGIVTVANVVDHIIPHKGDQKLFWDRKNWQALCTNCHNTTKAREEKEKGY